MIFAAHLPDLSYSTKNKVIFFADDLPYKKHYKKKQEVPAAEAQDQADVLKKKHLIQVLLRGREIPGKEFHC